MIARYLLLGSILFFHCAFEYPLQPRLVTSLLFEGINDGT